MNIKVAFTKNGPVMADFHENLNDTYVAIDPVILQPGPNNKTMMFPLLGFVEEKKVTISKSDLNFDQLFTPVIELRNAYSTQFGSGLQLVTK